MREILFRAKRTDNGEWAESRTILENISESDDKTYCIGARQSADLYFDAHDNIVAAETTGECLFYDCDPETIGQYTGLTDKNGKKIFEGDIVKQTFEKTVATIAIDWGADEYEDLYGEDVGAVVIIPSKGVCIKNPVIHREVNGETTQHGERARMYKTVCSGRCEVIGNIHDNPELLEGE